MLPSFSPFPPASVRKNISQEDWEACLDCWTLLAQRNLHISSKEFDVLARKELSMVEFIVSFMTEFAEWSHSDILTDREKKLKREIFLLTHRVLREVVPIPEKLQQLDFQGDFCIVYGRYGSLKSLLEFLWDRVNLHDISTTQDKKRLLIQVLDSGLRDSSTDIDRVLLRMVALLKVSFQYGQFLMVGSDFLDALAAAFEKSSSSYRPKIAIVGYLCLISLLESRRPQTSTLLDHLYSLKSSPHSNSLIQTICLSTPLVRQLRENLCAQNVDRVKPLMQELEALRKSTTGRITNQLLKKSTKGKEKALNEAPRMDMHVHKMSLVTQIQDLFPDLSSQFVVKLLAEYNDDSEQVIAHLLEDSLPAHLKQADRAEVLHQKSPQTDVELPKHDSSPLPTRRNIHDNDAFDRLAIPASSLTQGRSSAPEAAMPPRPSSSAKAAILSALATFDSDSDERDDTYDATDVGGTVDTALPGTSDDIDPDQHDGSSTEEALFRAFQKSPAAFDRDAGTRRGPMRAALKDETGMTDEAIEGWAIMLKRNPWRLQKLETRFSTSTGGQREIPSSAYRQNGPDSATEDSDFEGPEEVERVRSRVGSGPGKGHSLARGRGRGRGGRVDGEVSNPADKQATQLARQRKDAHKGSRANHNRRDQRARKMARGGGMAG